MIIGSALFFDHVQNILLTRRAGVRAIAELGRQMVRVRRDSDVPRVRAGWALGEGEMAGMGRRYRYREGFPSLSGGTPDGQAITSHLRTIGSLRVTAQGVIDHRGC